MAEQEKLTVSGHLGELRRRLTYCVIGVVITTGFSFFFVRDIFEFLKSRAPEDVNIVYIGVTEMLGTYIKLAIYCGVTMALPFLLYQVMVFVAPGLTRSERKNVTMLLVGVVLFSICGAVFTYFILLPPALGFLLNFSTDIAEPMISIGSYISVVTRLIFWVGMVFNLPILMYFLSRIGILDPSWLARNWKWSFLVAFALGAVITPTMDPINQTLVAAPIVVLYFAGIALAQFARRGKKKRQPVLAVAEQE